jgi:hypothetical protein
MKDSIIKSNDSPRNVVSKVLKGVNIDVLRALVSFDLIYRILRRHRCNSINPMPYAFQNLKLIVNLSLTHTGDIFYRFGIDNYGHMFENDNILLFYSDFGINKLFSNSMWAVDGTFKVVSAPYKQLFTISFIKTITVFLASLLF